MKLKTKNKIKKILMIIILTWFVYISVIQVVTIDSFFTNLLVMYFWSIPFWFATQKYLKFITWGCIIIWFIQFICYPFYKFIYLKKIITR